MALSFTDRTGDGQKVSFTFGFTGPDRGYIRQSDIHVFVNGTETSDFVLTGENQLEFNTAPEDGAAIRIRRIMPRGQPFATFARGSSFNQTLLYNDALQQLYLAHELLDGFGAEVGLVNLREDVNFGSNDLLSIGVATASRLNAETISADNLELAGVPVNQLLTNTLSAAESARDASQSAQSLSEQARDASQAARDEAILIAQSFTVPSGTSLSVGVSLLSDLRALPVESLPTGRVINLSGITQVGKGGGSFIVTDLEGQDDDGALTLNIAGKTLLRFGFDKVTPEMFGGGLGQDDTQALSNMLSSGFSAIGTRGVIYNINSQISVDDVSVDFNLNGAVLRNNSSTDRSLIFTLPFEEIQQVSSVNLSQKSIEVQDGSAYDVGDRIKVVSRDRCAGNRPVESDGRNYWQSQTLTIESKSGNIITFRESFESDFTFTTQPQCMRFSQKSVNIYGGTLHNTRGFSSSRRNGLVRVRGGCDHLFKDLLIPNANNTALEFWGCDGLQVLNSTIRNIGQASDTSASHGISVISCNDPIIGDSVFTRNRHGFTNNDTPTQYSDNNYYVMGPTYDLVANNVTSKGDTASGFSTHHGLRGAVLSNVVCKDCAGGLSIRGWDVKVRGADISNCPGGVLVFSEPTVSGLERTTRWELDGVSTRNILEDDLQVQRCGFGVLGNNQFKGGAPRGWFFNLGGTVVLQGSNEFFSDGTFNLDDNYLHTIGTTVEVFSTLTIGISGMTLNGTNNVIRCTSNNSFRAYAPIIMDDPVGINDIFVHTGTGETRLKDVYYRNSNGFPIGTQSGAETSIRVRREDGTYSSAYQFKTASANYNLSFNNAADEQIYVSLSTANGEFSLQSISNGKFEGQRFTLLVVDSVDPRNGFTIPNDISNLEINGDALVLPAGEARSFFWTGSSWVIESRTY